MDVGLSGLYDFSPPALQQLKTTGARFVRVVISWRAVAPAVPPAGWDPSDPGDHAYDWREVDERVAAVEGAGMTPLALVTEAPRWAERCTPEKSNGVCDPDPAAFAAFAHAAAVRYSGSFRDHPRISYWEPINEPNLSLFFDPQFDGSGNPVSPDLYRVLLNSFAEAVKGVNPSNVVLSGGLGPIAVRHYTIGPMQFARQLLCMTGGNHPRRTSSSCEGGVHFDIFDMHPYTTGGPNHRGRGNDVEMGDLRKLQNLIKAAKRDGRILGPSRAVPLWIGELSWDTNPPDPGGLKMRIASRWISESMYRAWQAGVTNFFWYSLYDDPPIPTYSTSVQSGLYFAGPTVAENTPKETLYAFRFPAVAYPGKRGLTYWGRTFGGRKGKVLIQSFRKGRWHKLVTARANPSGLFWGVVKGSDYGRNKNGAVRAIFAGEASLPFSMRPVKEFFQPPFG